jgi:hypothetical protein
VPVSSVASEIEYIRLETGKDFMMSDPHIINVKDSLILFIGFKKIYLFSRNTGKFLYEISNFGRGPDEYSHTTSIYDENEDLFFVSTFKSDPKSYTTYYAYNFHGDIIKTVGIPVLFDLENRELPISRFCPFEDSLYLGYINNPLVNINKKLVIFRQNGDVLKFYPNYNIIEIEKSRTFTISTNNGMFFDAEDTLRFFELHTDTIFDVNRHNIQPRYHIEMGDLLLPYQLRTAMFSESLNYFHIRNMHESSRFLMFSVGLSGTRHIVCYDKNFKRTIVCNNSEDLDFYKYNNSYGLRCIGFSNDIDNFVPIGTDNNSITRTVYLIGLSRFLQTVPTRKRGTVIR